MWWNILKVAGKERSRFFRGINIPKEIGNMRPIQTRIRPNVILSRHAIQRMQGKDVSRETDTGVRAGETMYRDLEGVWYFEGAMDAIQEGIESGRFNSLLSDKYGKKGQAVVRLASVGHGRMGWGVKKHRDLDDTLIVTTYLDYRGLPQGAGANTISFNNISTPLHPINPPRMQSESWVNLRRRAYQTRTRPTPQTETFKEKVTTEAVKIPEFEEKYLEQLFSEPTPTNTLELRSKLNPWQNKSQGSKRDRFFIKLLYNAQTKWEF
tara:strand:+ start:1697 stop:2494 length:798 start_codon:yes stop_codon:yes gene_type:complete